MIWFAVGALAIMTIGVIDIIRTIDNYSAELDRDAPGPASPASDPKGQIRQGK